MKEDTLKPSELRIGNWVMYDRNELVEDPFAKPEPMYPYRIESGEDIDLGVRGGHYKPIPITGKILRAARMVKLSDNQWAIGSFELIKLGSLYYPHISLVQATLSKGMKYLHQLQNMYYCLEGKELEVKL